MLNFLCKQRSLVLLSLITALIAIGLLAFILPGNFSLSGYKSGSGDIAQHLSGWYAYTHEPWHFPLLKLNSLNYPLGTTISLTDSIPLFAIPFKLIRAILPIGFNYFGILIICIYIAQAFAALTLCAALKQKNILATIAFVIFSLTAPILNIRIGNEDSLACQFFILLALSGYFFVYFEDLSLNGCHWFFGILLTLTLLVHPYLSAMTYPFYLISLFRARKNQSLPWLKTLAPIVIMHSCFLLLAIVLGLGGAQGSDDFGVFSMNLLEPFYGGYFFHNQLMIAYGAQGEGFSYLGLGLMIMIAVGMILRFKHLGTFFKKYRALLSIAIFFFIVAIYGHIYFGHYKVIVYGVPRFFLTYDFRTNGRFFWPTWYILMTFAIITWINKAPKLLKLAIPLLLCLQVFDVSGTLNQAYSDLQYNFTPLSQTNPSAPKIETLMQRNKLVVFYPRASCALPDYGLITPTSFLASKVGVPINVASIAHYMRDPICGDDANRYPAMQPKLLISSIKLPSPTIAKLLQKNPKACQIISGAYYCEYP